VAAPHGKYDSASYNHSQGNPGRQESQLVYGISSATDGSAGHDKTRVVRVINDIYAGIVISIPIGIKD
jgi:hypothetical protein